MGGANQTGLRTAYLARISLGYFGMRARNLAQGAWLAGSTLLLIPSSAEAAEYAFSSYSLESVAFAAGLSPPT
jgi:hypothetical protein